MKGSKAIAFAVAMTVTGLIAGIGCASMSKPTAEVEVLDGPENGVRRRSPEFVRAGGTGGINRARAEANARGSTQLAPDTTASSTRSGTPAGRNATASRTPSGNNPTNNGSTNSQPPAPRRTRVAGVTEVGGMPDFIRDAARSEVPGASIESYTSTNEAGTLVYRLKMHGSSPDRALLIREDGVVLLNSRILK